MEKWKVITGYENYEVSSSGLVRSKFGNREILLKQTVNDKGYPGVTLSKNGTQKKHNVHHIVAKAFLSYEPSNGIQYVSHIDKNKTNNAASNLIICKKTIY